MMSLNGIRQIYQSVSVKNRLCEGCGNPIIRNLAILDGKLYHYGCMKKTKAKPTHLCLDCFSWLTAKGMTKTDFGDGKLVRACGNCGSTHLRPLRRRFNG